MKTGNRNRLIIIERAGPDIDDGYTTKPGEFAEYARAFAEVIFSTGSERREAAQEQASAAATFRVLDNPLTRAVTVKDRISFDGSTWDIQSAVPSKALNDHREITATRSV